MTKEYHLNLSIDFGGSGSKVIYQFGGGTTFYMVLPPGLEEISKEDFKRYKDLQVFRGDPRVQDEAWLEWKGNIYVVGSFATEFAAIDRIKERKYENALYKALAIIGIIFEWYKIGGKKRSVSSPIVVLHLAMLLPWNEYNDNERFRKQLELMLTRFKFRGVAWNVALETFLCQPEGAGLLAARLKQKDQSWFRQSNVALLMFGHRNTSCLYFERGIRKVGDSPMLGFSNFLDDVCSRVSGLERDRLAEAIFDSWYQSRSQIYRETRTKHPEWEKCEAIQSLATARDEQLRASEGRDIVKAIKDAIPSYWFKISRWLDATLPDFPDEVILGGGAAVFLEPELEEYFRCQASTYITRKTGERALSYLTCSPFSNRSDLVWLGDIQAQMEGAFKFEYSQLSNQLPFRLLDAFGMMNRLKDTVKHVKEAAQDGKSQTKQDT